MGQLLKAWSVLFQCQLIQYLRIIMHLTERSAPRLNNTEKMNTWKIKCMKKDRKIHEHKRKWEKRKARKQEMLLSCLLLCKYRLHQKSVDYVNPRQCAKNASVHRTHVARLNRIEGRRPRASFGLLFLTRFSTAGGRHHLSTLSVNSGSIIFVISHCPVYLDVFKVNFTCYS